MTYSRLLSFTTLVAISVTVLLNASPALGSENTALCNVHGEPCRGGNLAEKVHFASEGSPEVKGDIFGVKITMKCSGSLLFGLVESTKLGRLAAAPNPLGVTLFEVTWFNCKASNGKVEVGCLMTQQKAGLLDILKTELNVGTATWLNALVLISCEDFPIFGKVHCDYGTSAITGFTIEGALHKEGTGNGMLSATEVSLPISEALEGICISNAKLTVLYKALPAHVFITG